MARIVQKKCKTKFLLKGKNGGHIQTVSHGSLFMLRALSEKAESLCFEHSGEAMHTFLFKLYDLKPEKEFAKDVSWDVGSWGHGFKFWLCRVLLSSVRIQ